MKHYWQHRPDTTRLSVIIDLLAVIIVLLVLIVVLLGMKL